MPGINRDFIIGSQNKEPLTNSFLAYYHNYTFKFNAIDDLCIHVTDQHSGVVDSYFKNESLYLEGWFDDKTLNNGLMICNTKKDIIPICTNYNTELKLNSIILDKFPKAIGFTCYYSN